MRSIHTSSRKFNRTPPSSVAISAGQGVMLDDGTQAVITETQVRCPQCRTYKSVDLFGIGSTYCKACIRLYYKQRYSGRKQRDRDLRKNYGIGHEEYDLLWSAQGGVCACCGQAQTKTDSRTKQTRYLVVDHDHTTGYIRGLLCGGCNTALGLLREDPARIRLLLVYAERAQGLKPA